MPKLSRQVFMSWQVLLQYRLDMAIWTVTGAITPLIAMVVWLVALGSHSDIFSVRDTITYYVMIIFVSLITDVWNGYNLINDIRRGDLVKYLVKPHFVMSWYLADNIAQKVFKLLIPLPVLAVVMFFKPQIFSPEIYNLNHVAVFLVSLVLACVMSFLFDMSLAMVAFWTQEANELRAVKVLLQEVASGVLIPFAFLPPALVLAFSFLPYRFILSVPVEILMGRIVGSAAVVYLGWQVVWILGLSLIMRFLWTQGLKHYAVPGQ